MTYKFARLVDDVIEKYTFLSQEELQLWIDHEIVKYKAMNKVEDESKDKSFIRFKESLYGILNSQNKEK